MKRILNLIACLFGFHEWTTPFLERKCEVDYKDIERFGVNYVLKRDNRVFCKHCKKKSSLAD